MTAEHCEQLVRVTAPTFVAGLVMRDGICVLAAPILRKSVMGRTREQLQAYFARRGWKATVVR